MKKQTRELKKAGWVVGNVSDFLDLSPYEEALVEIRLALGDEVRASRKKANLTQTELAKLIHSSQSRVAKVETGDATVSIDLQVKAILASGKNPSALFSSIARKLSKSSIRLPGRAIEA